MQMGTGDERYSLWSVYRIIKSDIEMYISEKRRFKNLLSYPHRKNQSTKRVNSTTENFDFTQSESKERIRNSNLSVF